MSRRRLVAVVCFGCQAVLAREAEDGTWSVKTRAKVGDVWETATEWQERFVCPDPGCRAEGYVNALDLVFADRTRRRVRVPMRPFM